jgi:4-hydroxybenzoyl-CoA thioesterase
MGAPFVFCRPIRFDEIDAAGYVYYPKVIALAHEGLERLLSEAMPGGYARFVVEQRIGLPCVHVDLDFRGPLRFGDDVKVELEVTMMGTSSVHFAFEVWRGDGARCARGTYVVACAELDGPRKRALPDDLRATLARYSQV